MKKLSFIFLTVIALSVFASCNRTVINNANVASSTLTVRSSDWYWDNNTSWRVDINYENINLDVYQGGAVLVYMQEYDTWRQVPLTYYYSEIVEGEERFYSSSIGTSFYQGGISMFWTENDFYAGKRPNERKFRIVAIAAATYNDRQDVNYADYDAVKAAFQLAD